MSAPALPTFIRPPVVETVLGVQFNRIAGFSNAHLGAFWKHLRQRRNEAGAESDWNVAEDAPPIQPAFERFEVPASGFPEQLILRSRQDVSSRMQLRNADGDAMVQIQNGRLHYNWISTAGGDYRRYSRVRPSFDRIYTEFQQFLKQEHLAAADPNQWEVTYVNHIPRGTVWAVPGDWAGLFAGLPGVWRAPEHVRLESLGGQWHFEIPEQKGRLHIELRHARTAGSAAEELLRLTLTARGPVDSATGLAEGLDLGRIAIVTTFRDVTSRKAHNYWGIDE